MYVNTLGIQIEKSTYVFNIKIIPVPVPGKKTSHLGYANTAFFMSPIQI